VAGERPNNPGDREQMFWGGIISPTAPYISAMTQAHLSLPLVSPEPCGDAGFVSDNFGLDITLIHNVYKVLGSAVYTVQ
jgi:hypothetical protein